MEERIWRLESHLPDRLDDDDWETLAQIVAWAAPERYRALPIGEEARKDALLGILDELLEAFGRAEPETS